jgi:hypothetical protein
MAGVHDSRFPAHLEALRVPLLDTVDAGHLGQAIGKRLELDDTMGETNRQLLAKELGGLDERSLLLGLAGCHGGKEEGVERRVTGARQCQDGDPHHNQLLRQSRESQLTLGRSPKSIWEWSAESCELGSSPSAAATHPSGGSLRSGGSCPTAGG